MASIKSVIRHPGPKCLVNLVKIFLKMRNFVEKNFNIYLMTQKYGKIGHFAIILLTFALFSSCRNGEEYRKCGGMVWSTLYNITYRGPAELEDSIMPVLDAVARSVSAFDSASVVSRINANQSDRTDSLFRYIYRVSVKINRESNGKFDPTVGPLVKAWGFGKGHTPTADTARVEEIVKYVGIYKSRLEGERIVKPDPRMMFDFSAIAKGYGCDAVAAMFRRNGVKDFLIEIGGEIRSGGVSPRGGEWAVSIDAPIPDSEKIVHQSQCIINIGDCGVATSGDYRNYHASGGKRFGHTINPQTGRPAMTDVACATVVAPNTMEADAYATAIMAMGATEGRKMAERLKLPVYIVYGKNQIWVSPQFQRLLVK